MKKINLFIILALVVSLSGCEILNNPQSTTKVNRSKSTNETTSVNVDLNDASTSTPANQTEDGIKVFNLDVYNFFFSEKQLEAKVGDKITINLTSKDGIHDFTLDEYNIQSTIIDTNNQTNITFVADKVGEFEFYSSIGDQKELGAKGVLIVSE